MISKVSEKTMHTFRWVLAAGWFVLIFSLFFDPISHYLTEPSNQFSPFRDNIISLANDPALCVKVQGECLKEQSYQIGARVFWGMIVPSAIAIVFILGHEAWRRICPLYFISQIPRALGLKPRLKIQNNKWLVENHFYLQFFLFFIGLNCRILFVNSDRIVLGLFLLLTIVCAIAIVYLYGGRSWCHYICPFGIVQMVFTGPRGLLDSSAQKVPPRSITQSMCRTTDKTTGKEINACINCKSACFDIDSEKSYWNQLNKPGRKLVQYGYLGLVIGYFIYYFLYSGNFNYYFSGAWSHQENQLGNLFKAGFYIFGLTIPIPKIVATPLTLVFFIVVTYLICNKLEKTYRAYLKSKKAFTNQEFVKHRIFSFCTFLAFNTFYIYGGRPEISRLPVPIQLIFNSFIVLVSSLWLQRTWDRSYELYVTESKKVSREALARKNNQPQNQIIPADRLHSLAKNTHEFRCKAESKVQPLATIDPVDLRRWTEGEITVRCVQVIDETHDVKTFCFVALNPVLFTYKPGQFVTLDLLINGKRVMRSYSISSTPSRPHTLEITVKRASAPDNTTNVPPGLVSNWLHDNIIVGSEIKLFGPLGNFTCFANPARKLLFISAGSGITPIMSMSRWICDTTSDFDVVFFHSARSPRDIIFRQELELMAARHPNFKPIVTITHSQLGQAWFGYSGRINKSMLTNIVSDLSERIVYICGSHDFVQTVKAVLEELQFPMENYYCEEFGMPKIKQKNLLKFGELPQATAKPNFVISPQVVKLQTTSGYLGVVTNGSRSLKESPAPTNQPVVVFAQSKKEVTCNVSDSILEVAEQSGIDLPWGCGAGNCGACKQRLLEGQVSYSKQPKYKCDRDDVLICVARPIGQVVIDA